MWVLVVHRQVWPGVLGQQVHGGWHNGCGRDDASVHVAHMPACQGMCGWLLTHGAALCIRAHPAGRSHVLCVPARLAILP